MQSAFLITNLPDDVLGVVFGMCSVMDLVRVRQVCRCFRGVADDECVWKTVVSRTTSDKLVYRAVQLDNVWLLTKLLSIGGNVMTWPHEWSALHLASAHYSTDVVDVLIKYGADINATTHQTSSTPLHLAAAFGRLENAQRLVVAGANIHSTDRSGRTPLHSAVSGDHPNIVQYLISVGADHSTPDRAGNLPLHHAFDYEQNGIECIRILLGSGADANATNAYGQTALYMAKLDSKYDAVALLTSTGT